MFSDTITFGNISSDFCALLQAFHYCSMKNEHLRLIYFVRDTIFLKTYDFTWHIFRMAILNERTKCAINWTAVRALVLNYLDHASIESCDVNSFICMPQAKPK